MFGRRIGSVRAVVAIVVISSGAVHAGERIRIYKEFTTGMTYEEIRNEPGILDAAELGIPAVRLYREAEKFGGLDWAQLFSFHDNKLTDVSLVSLDIQQYQQAAITIANSGFSLVHMQSAARELDCVALYLTETQDAVLRAVDEFEREALDSDHLMLIYVDDPSLQKIIPRLTGDESPSQVLALFPANTRSATVVISALEDPENPFLTLTFSTPLYALSLLREDF